MVQISGQPIVLIVLLFALATSLATANENEYCPFDETVDLLDCKKLSNGTYTYEDISILPQSISEYNEVMQGDRRVKAAKHKRGCVTPNVQICCSNPKAILQTQPLECLNQTLNYTNPPKVNVTVEDNTGKLTVQSDFKGFFPKYSLPSCYFIYPLSKQDVSTNWSLKKNGVVYVEFDENNHYYKMDEYCLHPLETLDEYIFELFLCLRLAQPSTHDKVINIIMAISAAFMILTILINLFMVKKTNHQILFMLYLICLTVSFIVIIAVKKNLIPTNLCEATGYIGYFVTMATFSLLTVICVCMWNNFRGSNFYARQLKSDKQLVIGLMVSFGVASFFTLVVVLADNSSIPEIYRPNVGVYGCWIKVDKEVLVALTYYYGPMIVLFFINLVMFILTSARIFNLKKEVIRVKNSKNSQLHKKHLRFGKEFGLYLRMFFIMGTTWILEILAKFVESAILVNINDYINASQGIIIFVMFGNVRLVYKRIVRAKDSDTELSSTQTSAIRQMSASSAASTKRLLHEDRV